jgi:pantothenate kinase
MVSFVLNLAEQHWELNISRKELETVHLPLLKEMMRKAAAKTRRYVVFLVGPPGSGKTTIGTLWETLAREYDLHVLVQTLPMDGFHFPNAVLDARTILRDGESISLRKIKGAPESFDLIMITRSLRALCSSREFAWPKYDRQIHDPVPDAILVIPEGIIIVEGNYLLLDEPGWQDLKPMADLTIFIECDEVLVRESVLTRAKRGGRSDKSAVQHYEFSDRPNWKRVMGHRLESDVVLRVEDGRRMVRVK